jgi:uncharacterized damage-inducible protein DinB
MAAPAESAHLILKLFELRRDPVLREARSWFLLEFNPTTAEEFTAIASGPRNASVRMVLGYWDMAASLVTAGAIDAAMFRAANTEIVATFAKVEPFLEGIRRASGISEFCQHLEAVVRALPNADERLALLRQQFGAYAREAETRPADPARTFVQESRALLTSDYLPKIESCLGHLSDEDVWWRPNEASNSIGNLLLHLCGNVTQWILGGVGGRPYERRRQQEFDERGSVEKKDLLDRIRTVVGEADDVLGSLDPAALMDRRGIQGYDVTVQEAIYHVVEHFSMHTGQIILLTKARAGEDLRLWQPPAATSS